MTDALIALLRESRQRGFLGPGPVEEHLDHARAFAVAAGAAPARALDLGAGGGLPGLVLAAEVWPEARWTFVDAQLRRTTFLAEAVETLGIADRVLVVHGRAEEVGRDGEHRGTYDLVVARSFGPPAVVIECAAPLLRIGGQLVVSEPPAADPAERWPADGLAGFGAGPASPIEVDGPDPVHLVRIELVEACPEVFPRRVGIPAKRPAFG
jgi:16S rRNA (guanine527-N7)-methyltransferase